VEPKLTLATFAPHEGSRFVVDGGELGEIELVLDRVRSLGEGSARDDAFALEFVGPAEPVLGQQILPLGHEVLGRVDMFVVPLGPGPDGAIRYEAIFS
jgi:hypothetical protein